MGLQRVVYDLVTEQTTAKIFGMSIILLVETIWNNFIIILRMNLSLLLENHKLNIKMLPVAHIKYNSR